MLKTVYAILSWIFLLEASKEMPTLLQLKEAGIELDVCPEETKILPEWLCTGHLKGNKEDQSSKEKFKKKMLKMRSTACNTAGTLYRN